MIIQHEPNPLRQLREASGFLYGRDCKTFMVSSCQGCCERLVLRRGNVEAKVSKRPLTTLFECFVELDNVCEITNQNFNNFSVLFKL